MFFISFFKMIQPSQYIYMKLKPSMIVSYNKIKKTRPFFNDLSPF